MSCNTTSENDILATDDSSHLISKIKPECLQEKLADPEIEYDPDAPDVLGTSVLRPDPLSIKSEPSENAEISYRSSRKHRLSGEKKSVSAAQSCSKCRLTFRTRARMLKHLEQEHPDFDVSSIPKPRRRKKKKRLVKQTDASNQDSSVEKEPGPQESVHPEGTSEDVLPERPKRVKKSHMPSRFECEFCGEVFVFRRQIVYHLNSMHSNDDKFKCKYCGRFYGSMSIRRDHERVIHEGILRFKCHLCPEGFPRLSRLDHHLHAVHNLPLPEKETPDERKKRLLAFPRLCGKKDSEIDDPPAKLNEPSVIPTQNVTHLKRRPHGTSLRRSHPFKCVHCRKMFSVMTDRDTHLTQVHPDEYPFKCDTCGKPFPSVSHLNLHLRFMHRDNVEALPFACTMCPLKFVTAWSLKVHQNKVHVETSTYSCEWCGQLFGSYWLRHKHVQKEHAPAAGPFRCLFCKATFQRAANHRKHMARDHTSEFEKCGVPDVPRFQCAHCNKSYSAASNMRAHITRAHAPPKPFPCAHCTNTYERPSLLHRHVLQIHNVDPKKAPAYSDVANSVPRFTCQHCYQFYTTPLNLNRHIRLVHGASAKTAGFSKRTCSLCKQHFSSSSHLRNHINCVHKGAGAFRCHDCNVLFASALGLQKHKYKFHEGSSSADGPPTGQDLFACDICSSKFACRTHLEDHMRFTHSCRAAKTDIGETRKDLVCFSCNICNKTYIGQHALQRHVARAHGSCSTDTEPSPTSSGPVPPSSSPEGVLAPMPCYECHQCSRVFLRIPSLQWHMIIRHKATVANAPFRGCPHCGRLFQRSACLKRHVEKNHNDSTINAKTGDTRRKSVWYSCDICKKYYYGPSALDSHRAEAHNSNTEMLSPPPEEGVDGSVPCHECPQCDRTFRNFGFFKNHLKREHPDLVSETTAQPTTAS